MCHLLLGEVLTNTHSYVCPLLTRYNLHPFSPLTLQDIALTPVLFKNQHYPEFDGASDMFVPVLNVLLILAFLLEAWSKKNKPYLHKIKHTICTCLLEPRSPDLYEVCLCLAVSLDPLPPAIPSFILG